MMNNLQSFIQQNRASHEAKFTGRGLEVSEAPRSKGGAFKPGFRKSLQRGSELGFPALG